MESTINERVALLIKELRMSSNAFSKSIGKSNSGISFIVEGRSKPSFEVMEAICETYKQVNPTWLLRGEGEMFIGVKEQKIASPAPDQYLTDHVKQLEDSFTRLAQQLEVKDRQIDGLQRTVDALLTGKPDLSENVTWDIIRLNSLEPKSESETMEVA